MARSLRRYVDPLYARVPRGLSYSGMEFTPSTLPGLLSTDYFAPTASDATYALNKGFNLIRLAVLWERCQPTVGAALDSTYMGQIDSAIAAFAAAGLKTLIEVHNFGGRDVSGIARKIGNTQLTTVHFADLWSRLASRYVNNANVWGYDLMNEPASMPTPTSTLNYATTASWTLAAQAAITAIRAVDTSRYIVAEIDNFAGLQNFTTQYGSAPVPWWTDPSNKLYYSAHVYFDSDYSGTYSGANAWFSGSGGTVAQRGDLLVTFAQWAINNNLLIKDAPAIFMGEYGVENTQYKDEAYLAALNDFLNTMDQYQVAGTHWAFGNFYTSPTTVAPQNSYVTDRSQMAVLSRHLGTIN